MPRSASWWTLLRQLEQGCHKRDTIHMPAPPEKFQTNLLCCDPGRHLPECSGARAGKCPPPECFLSVFGHLAPSASKSTLGALGARCPKSLTKHSGGHFPARAPEHSRKWRPGSQLLCTEGCMFKIAGPNLYNKGFSPDLYILKGQGGPPEIQTNSPDKSLRSHPHTRTLPDVQTACQW